MSGEPVTFRPIPMTAIGPLGASIRSTRIPATLPPPASSTSFGHFSRSPRTPSTTATPASSGNQAHRSEGTCSGRTSTEKVSASPGAAVQVRSSRPRPGALVLGDDHVAGPGLPGQGGRPHVGVGRAGLGDHDQLPRAGRERGAEQIGVQGLAHGPQPRAVQGAK